MSFKTFTSQPLPAIPRRVSKRREDDDYVDLDAIGEEEEEPQQQEYSWTEEYKRSWDVLQEDAEGNLSSAVAAINQQRKRQRLLKDTATIQRGIIRHVFLIIDLSDAMNEKDLRPTRLDLTLTYVEQFITEYYEQNPISQLGIIVTKEGIATKITELSGNPNDHIRALRKADCREAKGEPSLQNVLDLARASLSHVPNHGSRECLVIFGSLTTCDPGNIWETIEALKRDSVRVSIVGLSAEIQICKIICKETHGNYSVILNEHHYKDLLFETITPLPVVGAQERNKQQNNLVMMGFPRRIKEQEPTFCVCHNKLTLGGYICPRCLSKICEVPTDCDICGLTLVSSPHLARSFHHLFSVDNYSEVPWSEAKSTACFSCQLSFETAPAPLDPLVSFTHTSSNHAVPDASSNSGRYACPKCRNHFCVDCDLFVHEVLHNCPGCWAGGSNLEVLPNGHELDQDGHAMDVDGTDLGPHTTVRPREPLGPVTNGGDKEHMPADGKPKTSVKIKIRARGKELGTKDGDVYMD